MTFAIDSKLHWTDHYVEYGFAVVKNLVDRRFTDEALEEVKRISGVDLPLNQWTEENIGSRYAEADETDMHILAKVYDDPRLRAAIDQMFGSPTHWSGKRAFSLFVKPYDANVQPQLTAQGHIDFVDCPIPIFGSGFMFQISLVKSEPFGGNITIYPGTHKPIQKAIMDSREWRYPADIETIPTVEPYEFVADPGDVLFFHHLVMHGGNSNHCSGRSPRVCLHCQGLRKTWLTEVDPATPDLSPWERCAAVNGAFKLDYDEQDVMESHYGLRPAK